MERANLAVFDLRKFSCNKGGGLRCNRKNRIGLPYTESATGTMHAVPGSNFIFNGESSLTILYLNQSSVTSVFDSLSLWKAENRGRK